MLPHFNYLLYALSTVWCYENLQIKHHILGPGLVPAFRLKMQIKTIQLGPMGKGIMNMWVSSFLVCIICNVRWWTKPIKYDSKVWSRLQFWNLSNSHVARKLWSCVKRCHWLMHVTKWWSPLRSVRTARRTPFSSQPHVNGCKLACYTYYPIRNQNMWSS